MGKRKLPEGWKISTLGELVRFERKTWRSAKDGVKRDENNVYRFLKSWEDQTLFTDKYDFDGEFLSIWDGWIANLHYVNGKFWASGHNFVFTTKNESVICCKYLYYHLFFWKNDWGKLYKWIGIKNISRPSLESIIIRFPSTVSEQKRIADELDRQFGAIEEMGKQLIENENRLSEFEFSRLSIISQNINNEGISLGEVVYEDFSGFAVNRSELQDDGWYPQIRPFNFWKSGFLDLTTLYRVPENLVDKSKFKLRKWDILYNNTNSTELVGKSIYVDRDYEFAFTNHINLIRVGQNHDSKFFFYCLQWLFKEWYFARNCKRWINQSGFTLNELKKVRIKFPDYDTQREIVISLDSDIANVNRIRIEIEKQKELIKNLRTSILHDVFWGFES